ncbi:MAG: outer membrane protein transport protein [Bacteroidetes bacterium]|nr:outer membrane protein transport protein [Bacteroidota bacterium]
MKHIAIAVLFLCCTAGLNAQLAADAIRYSYLVPGGTARFMGSGGAFTALGSEFSCLSQNPASLGYYRSNELVLTPSLYFSKTDATLHGNEAAYTDSRSNFGFDNAGLVFATQPNGPKWKMFNVGLGVNRLNSFHQSVYYEGNSNGSIINTMYDQAKSTLNSGGTDADFDPYYANLAYKSNGLYYQDNVFTSDFEGNRDASISRAHQVNTYGRMNELVFSMAGNYEEKLMLGATVGVPIVNYRLESEYTESDNAGLVNYFDKLKYTDYLQTEGFGINAKFGLIYKINQAFRVGAAFHTPTLLGLTDSYSNSLEYTYTDNNGQSSSSADSPEGKSNYNLRTPWRAMAGAAVVIKKFSSLSADVEVVDYSSATFDLTTKTANVEDKKYESSLNRQIQQDYRRVFNYRFGAQFAFDVLRLRAGLNLLGRPDKSGEEFNVAYSAGLGVRLESFYIDLGYQRYVANGKVSAFDNAPVAYTTTNKTNMVLTLGLKF